MLHLLALFGVILFANSQLPPPLPTPQAVAEWAECDPDKVAFAIGTIPYRDQGPTWWPSETCLTIGYGDCKCFATIAKDTLSRCNGYEARIKILKPTYKASRHAITLFTDHKGRRGYINGHKAKTFYPDTDWNDIIDSVGGGPWQHD